MTALTLARRLDPCVAWFRVHARTRGAIMWAFPGLLLGGWLGAVFGPEGMPLHGPFELRASRLANAPLLSEARRLGLTHDTVTADPAAALGKPVAWCVGSVDGERGRVGNRAIWPVLWSARSPELRTNIGGSAGYCFETLAIVEAVQSGVVRLRLVQKL